jgi:hypothetical protein
MKTKNCIVCNVEKVVSEYYVHRQMADGHLNKCKECCKSQATKRHHELFKDESFVESERQRGREKYKRLNYLEKYRNITDDKPWMKTQIYKNLHRNYKCEKGYELHHWNYNYLNDVLVMTISEHRKIHKKMKLDKEKKIFIYDGMYLDTLDKHKSAIEKILSKYVY